MPQPSQWTPEEKLTAVLEAAALSGGALEAFLHRRGLQPTHVEQWRHQVLAALHGPQGHPSPASFLDRMLATIDEHLADDRFQVEDLARYLAVSRSLLFQRLKELDQPPPARIILDRRLRRAAELLARGKGSISEIAYAAGFGSASSFTQSFRKHFGVVPSAYRAGCLDDFDRSLDENGSSSNWVFRTMNPSLTRRKRGSS